MADIEFNASDRRYEKDVDGHIVYADIRKEENVIYIDYVYAPPALRGQGAAGEFMRDLMGVFLREKYKVKPLCGYAASWLRKHKNEYADIVV